MKGYSIRADVLARRLQPTLWLLAGLSLAGGITAARAGALEDYVAQPDNTFTWKKLSQTNANGFTVTHLRMTSQKWREFTWTHDLQVVCPDKVRNPSIALLLIGGSGNGTKQVGVLQTLAKEAGALAAIVTDVPNQPLYEDRSEDALISYTFLKYLETGDPTWPLLFPMAKSAVRAMDALQALASQERQVKIESFVVGGASKRGWTTWLAAAADPRIKGIAPMIIDMLNMKVQLDWSKKVYGRPSEQIHDYTDLKLDEKMDDPRMVTLRSWVDPYSYRQRYTMPKLILLGSNDPYWTVDSLRNYWNDLPGPKLLYIAPNARHEVTQDAVGALAAFYQMIADRQELPTVEWQIGDTKNGKADVTVKVNRPAKAARLWTTYSQDRDFRDDHWTSTPLPIKPGSSIATGVVETPAKGYRAYMVEVLLVSPTGEQYKLSTESRVTPDSLK